MSATARKWRKALAPAAGPASRGMRVDGATWISPDSRAPVAGEVTPTDRGLEAGAAGTADRGREPRAAAVASEAQAAGRARSAVIELMRALATDVRRGGSFSKALASAEHDVSAGDMHWLREVAGPKGSREALAQAFEKLASEGAEASGAAEAVDPDAGAAVAGVAAAAVAEAEEPLDAGAEAVASVAGAATAANRKPAKRRAAHKGVSLNGQAVNAAGSATLATVPEEQAAETRVEAHVETRRKGDDLCLVDESLESGRGGDTTGAAGEPDADADAQAARVPRAPETAAASDAADAADDAIDEAEASAESEIVADVMSDASCRVVPRRGDFEALAEAEAEPDAGDGANLDVTLKPRVEVEASAGVATCTASKGAAWRAQQDARTAKGTDASAGAVAKPRAFQCGDRVRLVGKKRSAWLDGQLGALVSRGSEGHWNVLMDRGIGVATSEKMLRRVTDAEKSDDERLIEKHYDQWSERVDCLEQYATYSMLSSGETMSLESYNRVAETIVGNPRWSDIRATDREMLWSSMVSRGQEEHNRLMPTPIKAAEAALENLADELSGAEMAQDEFEICMRKQIEQKLEASEAATRRFEYARHHLYMRHVVQCAQGPAPRTSH